MKYRTEDGEVIEGASPDEIVKALRDGSRFASDQNEADYIEGFADRYREYSESLIRSDTSENFVADLLKVGYLQEVP